MVVVVFLLKSNNNINGSCSCRVLNAARDELKSYGICEKHFTTIATHHSLSATVATVVCPIATAILCNILTNFHLCTLHELLFHTIKRIKYVRNVQFLRACAVCVCVCLETKTHCSVLLRLALFIYADKRSNKLDKFTFACVLIDSLYAMHTNS